MSFIQALTSRTTITFIRKYSWFLFILTLSGFGAALAVWLVKSFSPGYSEAISVPVAPAALALSTPAVGVFSPVAPSATRREVPRRSADPFATPSTLIRRSPYTSPRKHVPLSYPPLSPAARAVKEDLESPDAVPDVYQCITCGHVRNLEPGEKPSKLVGETGCKGGPWEMMFPDSTPHEYRPQNQMGHH